MNDPRYYSVLIKSMRKLQNDDEYDKMIESKKTFDITFQKIIQHKCSEQWNYFEKKSILVSTPQGMVFNTDKLDNLQDYSEFKKFIDCQERYSSGLLSKYRKIENDIYKIKATIENGRVDCFNTHKYDEENLLTCYEAVIESGNFRKQVHGSLIKDLFESATKNINELLESEKNYIDK